MLLLLLLMMMMMRCDGVLSVDVVQVASSSASGSQEPHKVVDQMFEHIRRVSVSNSQASIQSSAVGRARDRSDSIGSTSVSVEFQFSFCIQRGSVRYNCV